MKTRIFIDGSEGTTGLRIHERFANRSDVELISIDPELRKDVNEREKLLNSCDIAFLCLPDAAARESASLITNPEVRVLDTSTAHRTDPNWAYGFPELSASHREAIKTGKRVAVPGCHASGFIALVYPLITAGALSRDAALSCFSLTGYSGGGKKMIAQYEDAERDKEFESARVYALGQTHKHLAEMRYVCGLEHGPVFSPIIGDYYSGMISTLPLHRSMLQNDTGIEEIKQIYKKHYAGEKFVRVRELPEGALLAGNELSGIDRMDICICGNAERMTVSSVFDNLGKGASGAAVQCMNLMLGMPEDTGLKLED